MGAELLNIGCLATIEHQNAHPFCLCQSFMIPTIQEKIISPCTEARIPQNEADFRRLFEHSPLPMYVYDLNSLSFLEVNQAAIERYGYSREEFLQMRITDIRPQDEVPRLLEYLQQSRDAFELPGHWQHQRRDGSLMQVNLALIQLEFAGRAAAQVIVEDITDQLALEARQQQLNEQVQRRLRELMVIHEVSQRLQQLEEPETLAHKVIEALEEIFHYDHCAVLLIDEAQQQLVPFSHRESEALSGCATDSKGPAYSSAFPLHLGICGWVVQHGESLLLGDVRKDLRYRQVNGRIQSEICTPIRVNGKIIGVIDMESIRPHAWSESERRVLETISTQIGIAIQNARLYDQLQRHADELEVKVIERTADLRESNAELEAFAYSVSHDLRAPLRAMEGFSRALLEEYLPQLDESGQDFLRRVCAASQRMSDLIDDLLHLSRITRSSMLCDKVDLSEIASRIADDFSRLSPQRKVKFEIQKNLSANGDFRLLRVALENLLGNAWKFTGRCEMAQIAFGQQQANGIPVWFVRDNGAGFDMEYADQLFAPFQRLHDASEFPGNGIGLATVQRIIHRHSGRLWAESQPGFGATFYFTLQEPRLSAEIKS
jgi:PAS domain S-box-containing protein